MNIKTRTLTILFLVGLAGVACHKPVPANQVCAGSQCVEVEVVHSLKERQRGLQFRDSLGKDKGMLFVFEESLPHSFWMKDTWIPLDMIWMDHARRVVHIQRNVPPCKQDPCYSYTPPQPALYVLEVNAGKADQMGIKVGYPLNFKLIEFLNQNN